MSGRLGKALVLALALAAPAAASPSLVGRREAPPLPAWSVYCTQLPNECRTNRNEPDIVTMTPELMDLVEAVNAYVNRTIVPVTDLAHRGVVDVWEIPTDGKGDCEDFQLLKRKFLVEGGLPRRALLMTVVIDESGDGHAVLTLRSDRGDFILDNKTYAVKRWDATSYIFVKREAETTSGWAFTEEPPAKVATAGQ